MEGAVFRNEEGGCVLPREGAEAKGGEVGEIDRGYRAPQTPIIKKRSNCD